MLSGVRLGEQYSCESSHVTINGATSRSRWACHQSLLNALAYTIEGAALLAFIEKTAIQDAPARLNPTCACQYRG